MEGAIINSTELIIPIDFKALASEHGVKKGSIWYSDTFKSWVIQGHPEIDLICINAPFEKGQIIDGMQGDASIFNGLKVSKVVIRSNSWVIKVKK